MNEMQSHEFEVFRAGDYGENGAYTEADLDSIASSYDPAKVHHAPVVLGHPKTDAPAYGWVESLRRVGNVLKAKVQLLPEMIDLVKRGLYTQRSIALYRDTDAPGGGKPYLKHLGFLGATPPVIKGLAPVELSEHEGQFVELQFSDGNLNSKEQAQMNEITFSEAQHKAILDAELTKKEGALRAEFSEALTAKDTEITTLKAQVGSLEAKVAEFSEKALKAEVDNFVESLAKGGKLEPARKDKVAASLLKLAKVDALLFAEQKEIYSNGPQLIEFGEHKDADGGTGTEELTDADKQLGITKEVKAKYAGKQYRLGS